MDNWEVLLGIATVAIGIWQYLDTRKNELAWKRTEFLFQEAEKLDNDNELREMVMILEGRNKDISIDQILELNLNEYMGKLDKLLNFLDRHACATLHQKTISIDEAANFGHYLRKIAENKKLSEYCKNNGFKDILGEYPPKIVPPAVRV